MTSPLDGQNKTSDDKHQEAALAAVGVTGVKMLSVKGARLNNTKEQKATVTYDSDKRLEINVVPQLPLLEVCCFCL